MIADAESVLRDAGNAKVLLMGLTFKENCPDLRNTRATDIITELQDYGIRVDVYDPWVQPLEAEKEYGITLVSELKQQYYSGIVIAVAHRQFMSMTVRQLRQLCTEPSVIYDVKSIFPQEAVDGSL